MSVCKLEMHEADKICETLLENAIELSKLNERLNEIKILELEKTSEEEILSKIALLRGEKYAPKDNQDNITEIENQINEISKTTNGLENSLFGNLKNVILDIPLDIPQIGESQSTLLFENGKYSHFTEVIAPLVGLTKCILIDDVEFHEDKITVNNVTSANDVVEKIFEFIKNLGRLASIKMNETDVEIMEIVEIIYGLKSKEIWEATEGIKDFSYRDIYEKLGLTDAGDKKDTRNFILNLETTLKDKYPFNKKGNGVFEFNFLGLLVWNAYVKKYGVNTSISVDNGKREELMKEEQNNTIKDESPKQESMNGFMEEDLKKILYGGAIKDDS